MGKEPGSNETILKKAFEKWSKTKAFQLYYKMARDLLD